MVQEIKSIFSKMLMILFCMAALERIAFEHFKTTPTVYLLICLVASYFFVENLQIWISKNSNRENRVTLAYASVFSLFTVFGLSLHNEVVRCFPAHLKDLIITLMCICGIVLWFFGMLTILKIFFVRHEAWIVGQQRSCSVRLILLFFAIIWIMCFIEFLNIYPGVLCYDSCGQLEQAVSLSNFENLNPLINTLFLIPFVQIGLYLSDINIGIALYTLFQMTLYTCVATYILSVLWVRGVHKILIGITLFWYAFMPVNIIFATGMWKDTFFAVFFGATVIMWFDQSMKTYVSATHKAILFIVSLIASLARNSGWSSLLAGTIVILLFCALTKDGEKEKLQRIKRTTQIVLSGTIVACICILVIYPVLGITSKAGNIASSLILQQIGRTATYCELTEHEKEEIDYFGTIEHLSSQISECYDERLSDQMKWKFDADLIKNERGRFLELWAELGKKHPDVYFDAIVQHTLCYWWLDDITYIWDYRIVDNSFGVVRQAKIFPEINLAQQLYEITTHIPKVYVLSTSSFALWVLLIGMYLCKCKGNKVGLLMHFPMLFIYLGLFLVSPGALFRYTYSVTFLLPIVILLLSTKSEKDV